MSQEAYIFDAIRSPRGKGKNGSLNELTAVSLSAQVLSTLKEPIVNIEKASELPEKVKLYPQEKWQWGWNNSSEVWNGRVAMIVFLILFIELILGSGPLHKLGIL